MGHPVILIHGMWCNGQHMQLVQNLLRARGYDCHTPTLPAHAPAPDQPAQVGALSIREYVNAVEGFIKERQFAQAPVLLGHSMGGLIAQLLAPIVQPAALVLLTPGAPAGIHALTPEVLGLAAPVLARWGFWRKPTRLSRASVRRNALNRHSVPAVEKIYPTLVAESGRAAFELALWWADSGKATVLAASAVRCPVYVVSAGQDRLTPASVVKKVAGRYANSTLRVWPERDHWVIDDEDTEDMVHEIDGWLRPVLKRTGQRSKGVMTC